MFNASWLLVAAVYTAAVWLTRRAGLELRWRVAGFFYLLVFIFLHQSLTGDMVNLPADFLRILPPWTGLTRDHRPINSDINDLVLQIAPWAHQVRESWRSLEFPLWNHLSGGGYPLLANGQSSAFSPLRLFALPLPLGQSFAAEAAMKILAALTFTFLFCRRRGYSEIASSIGAICFGFCSFLITWLHFPLVTVAAFVPAALLQIDLLAEKRTFGRFAFAAALWATLLFGGHPETVAHIFFISLLYLLWIVLVERPFAPRDAFRFILTLGGALAVAGLLAAPFLAPFAEALTRSKRYQELQVSPQAIGYYSDWPSFVVLLQPHFYGQLPFEKSWGPATAESISGFAGALGIGAWLALLIHVVASRSWRSREAFFVISTVIVLGIVMAWPGISDIFHLVFRLAANVRLRLLFCFLLAMMTAAAIDLLLRDRARIAFLIGVCFSAAVLLYLVLSTPYELPWHRDTAIAAIVPSMLVLLIACTVPFAGRFKLLATSILAVAILAELWNVSRAWNPNVPASTLYAPTPLIEALQKMKAAQPSNAPFRMVGIGPAMFTNVPAVFGFEDVRAHDPMANGRYLGVLRVLTGYNTADYFAQWKNYETGVLDFLNVRWVVTDPRTKLKDQQRFALVYEGRDGRIYENLTVLPRFFSTRNVVLEFRDDAFFKLLGTHNDWANTALLEELPVDSDQMRSDLLAPRPFDAPHATLQIVRARPTDFTLRVDAPRHTMVVSSIPWWPGWRVASHGGSLRPVRVNGGFLGFVVPPGISDVRVRYAPMSFRVGFWVALATALGMVGFGVWNRKPS
ncbi:MAG: YfhO family protein [Thermoanaerobaculia bacterium]|nr:YfhO family protein [Thermoanaerobaculia bacterium]